MLSNTLPESLPLELSDRLLAVAICRLPRELRSLLPRCSPPPPSSAVPSVTSLSPSTHPLHTLLCVLGPRFHAVEITMAALTRCWWVDLDFASRIGDLGLLQLLDRLAKPVGKFPFKRPLEWTNVAMDQASKLGYVHVLDWWYNRFGAACWYSQQAMTGAAANGHLRVLQWWMDHKAELLCEFPSEVLVHATMGGHVDVCRWWLDNHPNHGSKEIRHGPDFSRGILVHALMHAISANDPAFSTLHWWLGQSLLGRRFATVLAESKEFNAPKILDDYQALVLSHHHSRSLVLERLPEVLGQGDLQECFKSSSLIQFCAAVSLGNNATAFFDEEISSYDLVMASRAGNVHLVSWIVRQLTSEEPFPKGLGMMAVVSMSCASEMGHLDVLKWWSQWFARRQEELAVFGIENVVKKACENGHLHVLEWWENESGLPVIVPRVIEGVAKKAGNVPVLDWCFRVQPDAVKCLEVLLSASRTGCAWANSLRLAGDDESMSDPMIAIIAAAFTSSVAALDWWSKTPWFDGWFRYPGKMFAMGMTGPSVLHWWMDYLIKSRDAFPRDHRHLFQFGKFCTHLFVALAHSSCTVLLTEFVKHFGLPPIVNGDMFYGQGPFRSHITNFSLRVGHVCMLDWLIQTRLVQPDPKVFGLRVSKLQNMNHVKAWWARKVQELPQAGPVPSQASSS